MYGGHWAGETTHALSALYSATLEFDTVSHDMAQCASLIAPYGCPFSQKNRKIQERLPELPLFSFP